jgi:hypothetical protein
MYHNIVQNVHIVGFGMLLLPTKMLPWTVNNKHDPCYEQKHQDTKVKTYEKNPIDNS